MLSRNYLGTAIAAMSGGAAPSSLLTDLVSFYSLGNTTDAHASNTLTNTNSVAFSAGKVGNAADFDRASSQKLSATLTGLSANSTGSVAFWYKRNGDTAGAYEGIVQVGDDVDNFGMLINANIPYATEYVSSANQVFATNSVSLTDNTWYHFAITWEAGANNVIFYKNAASIATGTMSAVTLGTSINIGYAGATGNYIKGSVDELGVWNRVITGAEVTTLYNGGSGLAYPF